MHAPTTEEEYEVRGGCRGGGAVLGRRVSGMPMRTVACRRSEPAPTPACHPGMRCPLRRRSTALQAARQRLAFQELLALQLKLLVQRNMAWCGWRGGPWLRCGCSSAGLALGGGGQGAQQMDQCCAAHCTLRHRLSSACAHGVQGGPGRRRRGSGPRGPAAGAGARLTALPADGRPGGGAGSAAGADGGLAAHAVPAAGEPG